MAGEWVIGVALSLAATLFGTLGKVFLKLAHSTKRIIIAQAAATLCVFALNPIFDALSYAYAAQSILAPMAGFSVVWNIVLSPYILRERVSSYDLQGSAVILIGCIGVGISGSHETPEHNSSDIFSLFASATFVRYAFAAVLVAAALIYVIMTARVRNPWRRFAFGALSGLVGGNLYFLKASVELIGESGDVWNHAGTYMIFVMTLTTAGGGIYILDLGLREYDALYLVATYQALLIIIGSLSGVIFFHENAGMNSWWQFIMYPLSIVTTVVGIAVLSYKHTHDTETHTNGTTTEDEVSPLIRRKSSQDAIRTV